MGMVGLECMQHIGSWTVDDCHECFQSQGTIGPCVKRCQLAYLRWAILEITQLYASNRNAETMPQQPHFKSEEVFVLGLALVLSFQRLGSTLLGLGLGVEV